MNQMQGKCLIQRCLIFVVILNTFKKTNMKLFIWKTSLNSVVMVLEAQSTPVSFRGDSQDIFVENRNIIKVQTRFQFESWS